MNGAKLVKIEHNKYSIEDLFVTVTTITSIYILVYWLFEHPIKEILTLPYWMFFVIFLAHRNYTNIQIIITEKKLQNIIHYPTQLLMKYFRIIHFIFLISACFVLFANITDGLKDEISINFLYMSIAQSTLVMLVTLHTIAIRYHRYFYTSRFGLGFPSIPDEKVNKKDDL